MQKAITLICCDFFSLSPASLSNNGGASLSRSAKLLSDPRCQDGRKICHAPCLISHARSKISCSTPHSSNNVVNSAVMMCTLGCQCFRVFWRAVDMTWKGAKRKKNKRSPNLGCESNRPPSCTAPEVILTSLRKPHSRTTQSSRP